MEQICNLVYFRLTDGKTQAQIAELEVILSDPMDRERMIQRQNAESMKALGGFGMIAPKPPAVPRRRTQP